MCFFPTAKTAALYLLPIKSYSKNTHPPSFLEWAVVTAVADIGLLPDPSTVVYEGQARFTILSAHLIRLEWSPTKEFVDAKTWFVQSRQIQPTPPTFNVTRNDSHLRINTDCVTLEYLRNSTTTFSQHNIRAIVQVNPAKGESVVWNAIPGEEYDGNLLGTIRTLDKNNDSKIELDCRKQPRDDLHCTYSVISRRGYALVDDTRRPQFDNDTRWSWIIKKQYSPPPTFIHRMRKNVSFKTCFNQVEV